MTDLLIRSECYDEPKNVHVADVPIDFETWLDATSDLDTELIKGVMVDRMAAQFPHEWIYAWLFTILRSYTRNRGLGLVLGSRSAVKIDRYNGRLPDILFVRADNAAIVQDRAIYGTPDLVIEIVSPNDWGPDLISLQTDYRSIAVPLIVFVDPKKKHVRVISKGADDSYADAVLTSGRLAFDCIPGFWIEVEWLFADRQPDEHETTTRLLREAEESDS